MGKTIYISDKDALDVDRVIVSSTGMEYKLLYSCDEIDNYEKRLKNDMVAMLKKLEVEIYEKQYNYNNRWVVNHRDISELINEKINLLKENT